MTAIRTCQAHCRLVLILLLLFAATGMLRAWAEDIPANAWQVDLLEPAPDSSHSIEEILIIRATAREAFYFPDYLRFIWSTKNEQGNWFDLASTRPADAHYQTGGYYTSTFRADQMGTSFSDHRYWRIKAISRKDGKSMAETPWRYFTYYDPDSVPDLYTSTFEPTPVVVGSQKRWHFVWTIRNKGNAIAPPSKLHVTCQTEDGNNCLSGISGTYSIPQLWPKPDDVSGAHKVWNDPPVALPPGAKIRLKATIDTGSNPEIATNNTVIREFVADATPFITPEELRRAAALENQASEAAGTIDDPIVNTLSDGTQTLLLGDGTQTLLLEDGTRTLPLPGGPGETPALPHPETPPVFGARTRARATAPTLPPMPTTPTMKAPAAVTKPPGTKADTTPAAPTVRKQVMLVKPVISYPKANTLFTAPVDFTVTAKVTAGKAVTYGVRAAARNQVVAKNHTGRFRKLAAGEYCVYVRYDPNGPSSQCVPFTVRLAVKREPVQVPAPKTITPQLIQKK